MSKDQIYQNFYIMIQKDEIYCWMKRKGGRTAKNLIIHMQLQSTHVSGQKNSVYSCPRKGELTQNFHFICNI